LSSQDLERRAPLASLTWCSVTLEARDRFLLDSGLDLSADELDLSRSDEDLVAAIPTGASVGLFAKLFGKAKAREGAVMLLSAEPATPAPDGWLTWLEFQTGRDLEFHCWGTEGGTEMATHSEPAAQRPTAEALLDILRTHPSIVREQFADLYDDEAPRDPELQELVPGTPERGFWRSVPPSELAEVFTAHTSSGPGYDLRSDQFLPGSALVDRMRDTLDQPAAVALHAGHEAEAAVVWFAVGGISRSSGQLECFLSERVWT
ncbi:MAG: hypothetical protein KC912_24665, partial [Proteobacteria bacterium]|nr:hypothetical protein [Pseudomonadota bacterium]